MAGLGGGNFWLAQQESEVESLLPESGAVGGFFEGGIQEVAGFLETAGLEKFVGPAGRTVSWFGASAKKQQGQKEKDGNFYHSFTFTFTFTKKKERTASWMGIRIKMKDNWKDVMVGRPR